MAISKRFVFIIGLCVVQGCLSKPTGDLTEARGVVSTLWGWVTYPFNWWPTEPTIPPNNDLLMASTTPGPYDNIEVGKRNVTVWCNDQTCTTMRCDNSGCYNITCNIYDTDLMGECRVYNTISTTPLPTTSQPTETISQATAADNATAAVASVKPEVLVETEANVQIVSSVPAEKPLELEAVISSTVPEQDNQNRVNGIVKT